MRHDFLNLFWLNAIVSFVLSVKRHQARQDLFHSHMQYQSQYQFKPFFSKKKLFTPKFPLSWFTKIRKKRHNKTPVLSCLKVVYIEIEHWPETRLTRLFTKLQCRCEFVCCFFLYLILMLQKWFPSWDIQNNNNNSNK